MRGFVLALGLLFAAVASPRAETTGELLARYDSAQPYGAGRFDRHDVELSLLGVSSGFTWANAFLTTVRKEQPMFCPPPPLVLTASQLLDVLRRSTAQNPTLTGQPWEFVLLASLVNKFPCGDVR